MNPQWVVFHGDALDLLRTVPDGSVDSIVTDPPAGISFMGREWDHHKGGRDQWIAWLTEITRECLRVLKPGGHALFWALPKTSHWTATAVEDGGFELRDVITHHFGCLSDDTEILVDGKWRTYAEATQGRSALCYDAERDLFFWGPIQDLFVYQYDDTAYTVRGDRTDQLVTREHRCTVERGSTVVFETAENLARQREARIPVLEDVQSLLGCLPRPDEGASCQEPALRTRVPRQEHPTTTNGAVLQTSFGLSSLWQAVQTSKQSASESKVLQHSVRGSESCRGPLFQKTPEGDRWSRSISLDRRQYDELPEKDDGTRESGVERRGHVQETARQLRGCEAREVPGRVSGDEGEQRVRPGTPSCCSQDLGSVFDATGSCAPHRLRPEKQPPLEPHAVCLPARSQAVRASRFTSSDLVRFEPVHYRGIVWCVRVATGAFVARRNGHVFVTGNSGMPKSADASKMIDKKLGTTSQRQVFATYTAGGNAGTSTKDKGGTYGVGVANSAPVELTRTLGGSPEARAWDGWGTGLKPSSEHWILARKPLAGTLADNLLRHGAGAINVDGCRVGTDWNEPDRPASWASSGHSAKPEAEKIAAPPGVGMVLHPGGRWPTNAVFTHSASCRLVGSRDVLANGSIGAHTPAAKKKKTVTAFGDFDARGAWQAHGNGDGTETVAVYDCADDCPVRVLERQSGNLSPGNHPKIRAGIGYGSTSVGGEYAGRQTEGGTAARFFPRFEWSGEHDDPFLYSGKASTKEREAGCEDVPSAESGRHNDHTTVKSVALMRWLVRLVTPPGGVCLDVFCGSGTTGVACVLEGFHFMGFEAEARFVDISRARIGYWAGR